MYPRFGPFSMAQFQLQGPGRPDPEERIPQRCCEQQFRSTSFHELVGWPDHKCCGIRFAFFLLCAIQPMWISLASHPTYQNLHAAALQSVWVAKTYWLFPDAFFLGLDYPLATIEHTAFPLGYLSWIHVEWLIAEDCAREAHRGAGTIEIANNNQECRWAWPGRGWCEKGVFLASRQGVVESCLRYVQV